MVQGSNDVRAPRSPRPPAERPHADRVPETDELAQLVSAAMGAMHAATVGDSLAIMADSGLTLPQLITLHVLDTYGPHTVGEIAGRTNLSRAATSHLVDRMVSQGLVSRSEDAEDRRQKRVAITRKGKLLADKVRRSRMEGIRRGLARLSPETRAQMAAVLERVVAELKPDPTGVPREHEDEEE